MQDKAFTCSFSDAFRRSPSYKLFWPEGWSNPEVFIQHTPSAGTVSFDFIHNMCTKHQPILMQCTCSDCNTRADEVRFGHKLMGLSDAAGKGWADAKLNGEAYFLYEAAGNH